jgi:nickel-dependent lactate racemase
MIYQRMGITAQEHATTFAKARFFNHYWDDPKQLLHIGTIRSETIAEISHSLLCEPVEVTINRMIMTYDLLVIVGPVFPHEVVGFSGGNKYLFPGIAGQEIIHLFHWLGALITNLQIIGRKDTPVRRVIDLAAGLVPVPRTCLSLVVRDNGLAGFFFGSPEEAWSAAADLSEEMHVVYHKHPYQKVLSCAPVMYDDLWTGGKCMYKLEPVVADGGELVIFAPHISQLSISHGAILEEIGYHVKDYYVKQMSRFSHVPRGIMAHSTHVKGIGSFENGVEQPRIQVTLATSIPDAMCRKINLGYLDPHTIDIHEWCRNHGDQTLLVQKAGEILHRLE